jgi:hypothetical protein
MAALFRVAATSLQVRFDTAIRKVYPSPVSDDLFPSGPWTGFYNYEPGQRHRMDLHLTFANGQLTGDGNDDVGRFTIRGRYDAATRECWWTKTYPGSHDVSYRGFREGTGIWGTWEINVFNHGGFHVWPRQAGEGDLQTNFATVEETADAIARETVPNSAGVTPHGRACALRFSDSRVQRTRVFACTGFPSWMRAGGRGCFRAGKR